MEGSTERLAAAFHIPALAIMPIACRRTTATRQESDVRLQRNA
jgi:hypothetical protein